MQKSIYRKNKENKIFTQTASKTIHLIPMVKNVDF
jgi:hypothetical protein